MSLPLIICFKRCNKKEKKIIEFIISKDTSTQGDLNKIIELMNKYNVKADCIKKAKHFSIMAKDSLGAFSDSQEKEKLINLADFLTERTK